MPKKCEGANNSVAGASMRIMTSHFVALLEATLVPVLLPGTLCLVVTIFYSISAEEPWRNDMISNFCEKELSDVMNIFLHIATWS